MDIRYERIDYNMSRFQRPDIDAIDRQLYFNQLLNKMGATTAVRIIDVHLNVRNAINDVKQRDACKGVICLSFCPFLENL